MKSENEKVADGVVGCVFDPGRTSYLAQIFQELKREYVENGSSSGFWNNRHIIYDASESYNLMIATEPGNPDKVIGFIACSDQQELTSHAVRLEIEIMEVFEPYRGRGYGLQMVRSFIEERSSGGIGVVVGVHSVNGSGGFWKKAGFLKKPGDRSEYYKIVQEKPGVVHLSMYYEDGKDSLVEYFACSTNFRRAETDELLLSQELLLPAYSEHDGDIYVGIELGEKRYSAKGTLLIGIRETGFDSKGSRRFLEPDNRLRHFVRVSCISERVIRREMHNSGLSLGNFKISKASPDDRSTTDD